MMRILFLLFLQMVCASPLLAVNDTINTHSQISDTIALSDSMVVSMDKSISIPPDSTFVIPRHTFSSDISLNSIPWIAAGIMLRNQRQNFRTVRDKFLFNFHNTGDNYSQYAPLAITTLLKAAGYQGRSSWGRYTASSAASFAIMALLVNSIKYSARELRPDGSTSNSFPSGHTATAFAAATILHKEYGSTRSPWFSIAGYALATATGCMRVLNNRHWVSDTFAGAGIGILSTELGYAIADLFFKERGIVRYDLRKGIDLSRNPSFFSVMAGVGLGHQSLRLPTDDLGLSDTFDDETPTSQLLFSNCTFVGAEGAYFFNPYVGVGGRLRVSSRMIKNWNLFRQSPLRGLDEFSPIAKQFVEQYTLYIASDHLSEFSIDAGFYFNLPLSPRLSLGTKLLVGRNYLHGIDIGATAKGIKKNVDMSFETVGKRQVLTFEISDNSDEEDLKNAERYETSWDYFNLDSGKSLNIGTGLSVTYAYKSFFAWRLFVDFDYSQKTYNLTYAPAEFIKAAAKNVTFNGQPANPNDYIHPYTSQQKKRMCYFSIGAAFSISF